MKYYHGSINYLKKNKILKINKEIGYVYQDENKYIEELFEKYRPKNKISRYKSIFLVDNLDDIDNVGANDDYIYEIEVNKRPDKSDLNWYTMVSIELDNNVNKKNILIYIKNYWDGIESKNPVFEYRTDYAKIKKIVENNKLKSKY